MNYVPLLQDGCNFKEAEITEQELKTLVNAYSQHNLTKINRLLDNLKSSQTNTGQSISNYTLCIHPSRACNLNCKYCFAKNNADLIKEEIDIDTAKKAIDFMIFNWGKNGRKYTIDISGSGEPLLKMNFIKALSDYCYKLQAKTGKEIKIMFPTNGALMTPEIADFFEKTDNILLGFSLDGNRVHNCNRILFSGEEAFDSSVKGIGLIKNRNYGIAVTITRKNEDVDAVYDYLINNFKNADAISMQVVRDYGDSETSFYAIDLKKLIQGYKRLIDKICEHFGQGDFNYISPLLLGVDTFGIYLLRSFNKGLIHKYRCGASQSVVTVDHRGKLYACTVENGNPKYLIGDIENGIDISKASIFRESTVENNPSCRKCWAAYICGGECFVTAEKTNNDFYSCNDRTCEFKKKLIELSIVASERIKNDYPEGYQYIINFIKKRSFFEGIVESSVWAIKNYFELLNIDYIYRDLCQRAGSSDLGNNPNKVKTVIKHYGLDFNFYKLDNSNSITEIKCPAIVLLNKYNRNYYEYAVLKSVSNDNVILKTNFNNDDILVSIEDFLFNLSDVIGFVSHL